MSLLDALFLDPAPFDTWVAYRQDGIKGSGTLNDPWNGSTAYALAVTISTLVNNGGDTREAIATATGHAYVNGDVVTITGVTGLGAARWNGSFAIYGVVSGVSFKYYMTAAPDAAPTQGDPIARFSGKWQVRRWAVENNVIELIWNIHPLLYGPPTGIYLSAGDYAPVYTFWQTLIRGNTIRSADNAPDPSGAQIGIQLTGCETAIVESNIIDLPYSQLLFYTRDKLVQFFDNSDSAGNLIRGQNDSINQKADEIATRLEDAMVLSL